MLSLQVTVLLLSQAGKPNKIAGVKEMGTKDPPFFTPIRTPQSTGVRYIAVAMTYRCPCPGMRSSYLFTQLTMKE